MSGGGGLVVVDGYNLLRVELPRLPARADALERARVRLVRGLQAYASQSTGMLLVVFDGRAGLGRAQRQRSGAVEILFTRELGGADAAIRELVEQERDRSRLLVVTSDRELAADVRGLGARVKTSQAFAKALASWSAGDAVNPAGEAKSARGGRAQRGVSSRPGAEEKPAYPGSAEVDEWEEKFRRREEDG